jgi:putative peptidoglycan lipid II flippase
MYLRAGVFSLGLLMASRLLGLLRESAQAAAFGATGLGDAVIVMFTLPDLLVGILFSGALGYVLLPEWARQTSAQQDASQKKVLRALLGIGLGLALLIWLLRDVVVHALAPGLRGEMAALGAGSLGWSAAALPLALLGALWATRLQHEHDFVGMYAGNLIINLMLVGALFLVPPAAPGGKIVMGLGCVLWLAMAGRLGWLAWRLPKAAARDAVDGYQPAASLPGASVWLWAALSSGLLLLLPLMGRSMASQSGEGALASFNYAWKLVELPLVLAIQLVAALAFPAIARTKAGTNERERALRTAFLLAWTLACMSIAVVATFSLPIAGVLFGWGRMNAAYLQVIADGGAVGIWSLLPQALMAVLLTVMATERRMHIAVWAYAAGTLALAFTAWAGLASGMRVMWVLNMVLGSVALVMMLAERRSLSRALPWGAMLAPLLVCVGLVALKPWLPVWRQPGTLLACFLYATAVMVAAVMASPILRGLLLSRVGYKVAGRVQ